MRERPDDPEPQAAADAGGAGADADGTGEVAVIFTSRRRAGGGADPAGYAAAADAMAALAAVQPGYRGHQAARGADGLGITVSWWADEAAALAWRDHPAHAAVRAAGRERWYERYEVTVARVLRRYGSGRPAAGPGPAG